MKATNIVFYFFINISLIIWNIPKVLGGGMSNFKIERMYLCEEVSDPKLTFFLHPRNFNGGLQLVDMNMSVPVPVGNDATIKILIEASTGLKNIWAHLFDIEGDFCTIFAKYMGEFWYSIQRAFAIMPHSCPVPRGTYHATNYTMDYETLRLQALPFGKQRITFRCFLKNRPEIQGCGRLIVSNTD